MLCDVQVKQAGGGAFDFRCAIVHLKSTDQQLKDKGNALRKAAAKALGQWLKEDLEEGAETDYLFLGDMNAETAEQGLEPFAGNDLKLLSVGMQDRYGKAEALTRVASKRLLDHIVVTDDAFHRMPKADEDEQIIIRSDTKIADWTKAFSDHVPVAVRFVLNGG